MTTLKRGLFVTGTDTGVGKTLSSCALIDGFAKAGLRVAAFKPVASGATMSPQGLRNDDALRLQAKCNVDYAYETLNPYCFTQAVSPHIAAKQTNTVVSIPLIRKRYDELAAKSDLVVVEGAGGWQSPISETATMADVATSLDLPVILVVGIRLGCLNHALLSRDAIGKAGLKLTAWIANVIDPEMSNTEDNIDYLSRHLGAPMLGTIPYLEKQTGRRPIQFLDLAPLSGLFGERS